MDHLILDSSWYRLESAVRTLFVDYASIDVKSFLFGDDPINLSLVLVAAVVLWCYLASVITGNCSQVDRLWSIVPFVYAWVFAIYPVVVGGEQFNTRLVVMAALPTVWGSRLTYNFARKGGYSAGEEDYRWPELRRIISNKFLYQIFNITFIATYQNILLFMIALPSYTAYVHRTVEWNDKDTIATALFLLFLCGETVADQQQWNFQTKKYELINKNVKRDGDYALGFLTHGLFRFSRHPNFFCEQSIWWSYCIFSCAVTQVGVHWTLVGALQLSLLFQGSTAFTEALTKAKYPSYDDYQKTTSRLMPWLPGRAVQLVTKKDK